MSTERRQIIGLSLALLGTSIAAAVLKPAKREKSGLDFESIVPKTFGKWEIDPTIVPVKPAPDAQANLDQIYDQLVMRTYKDSGSRRIMLTIAYGSQQTDKLKAHRQEVCYAAQGFRVSELVKSSISLGSRGIPVTRFLATQGYRKEPVSYWFTVGSSVVDSRFDRLLLQVRHGFLGEIPDGLLVRISSLHDETRLAYADHDEFAAALVSSIREKDQQRFVGAIS